MKRKLIPCKDKHTWSGWTDAGCNPFKRCLLCRQILTKKEFLKELSPRIIKLVPVRNEHINLFGF